MTALPPRFQFGPFELHTNTGELTKSGHPVRLPAQPSRVLVLLVRRAGETVTREEIQSEIWSDGTVVEFDQGLNFCIRQIRVALGEDARQPQYLETLPKRGYRFIAPAVPIWPEGLAPPEVVSPYGRGNWAAALVTLGALLLAGGVWWSNRPQLPGTPEADRLFLEAEHLSATGISENRPKAAERYEKVTKLAPNFAPAWASWSNLDVMMMFQNRGGQTALKASELHAKKALDLDDSLATAHANLAHSYWHQWKWKEARESFERAIEADASEPMAQHLYALFLAATRDKVDALARAKRAVELAPTSGIVAYTLAMVNLQTGEYEAAIAAADRTLLISRHYPAAYIVKLRANAALGRWDHAMRELEEGVKLGERDGNGLYRARLLAQMGRSTEARKILDAFHPPPGARRVPGELISALAALGDKDAAFAALNIAIDDHIPGLIWIRSDPEYEPLRSDPRFPQALARVGNP